MKMHTRILAPFLAFFVLVSLLGGTVSAQTRTSDKDVQKMMKNLIEDAKKFKSAFNSTIGKSEIRKTSREKESKQLVDRFGKQTEGLLKQFRKDKKADQAMKAVLMSADNIGALLDEVSLPQKTTSAWQKVETELDLLSKALGLD